MTLSIGFWGVHCNQKNHQVTVASSSVVHCRPRPKGAHCHWAGWAHGKSAPKGTIRDMNRTGNLGFTSSTYLFIYMFIWFIWFNSSNIDSVGMEQVRDQGTQCSQASKNITKGIMMEKTCNDFKDSKDPTTFFWLISNGFSNNSCWFVLS